MRISDWSSDVCSSDLIAHRFIFELQFAAPQQCVEILVHRSAVADLRDLIVLVVIKEGAEVDRHSAAEQRVLHADLERIDIFGLEGPAIFDAGQAQDREPAGISVKQIRSEEHTSELQSLIRNS